MFRIWFKIWNKGRIVRDMTIERPEEDTRTHKIFRSIEECAREFDIEQPIWLEASIQDFKRHSRTRFTQDNFMEQIDFDYMEMEIIEED